MGPFTGSPLETLRFAGLEGVENLRADGAGSGAPGALRRYGSGQKPNYDTKRV